MSAGEWSQSSQNCLKLTLVVLAEPLQRSFLLIQDSKLDSPALEVQILLAGWSFVFEGTPILGYAGG